MKTDLRTLVSFRFAYEHARAGIGRIVLSICAVVLGVSIVVAIRLMNASVLASFLDTIDAMVGRAALSVTTGEGLTFDEDLAGRIAKVPGVALAVPLIRGVAFLDDGSGEALTVHGVDLVNEPAVRLYHDAEQGKELLDDPLVILNQPNSIIIGKQFADERGLASGSAIKLATPTGLKDFVVRGLLEPHGIARTLRGRLVVMDLYAAQRVFGSDRQVNQIDVVLEKGARGGEVQQAIAAILPAGLSVDEPQLRKAAVERTVAGFQAMLTAFSLLAALAGFVICYSRLGSVFEARKWEVGLLRAVGLSRSVVFRELLKESLLLGSAGVAMGLVIGTTIAQVGLPYLASSTSIALRLPVLGVESRLHAEAYLWGTAVGLLAAVAAATVPALRLARTQPVAALTMRGRELPLTVRSSRSQLLWLAALTATIAVLVVVQKLTRQVALGNGITMLIALAICLAAAPMVEFGSRLLRRPYALLFGSTTDLAIEQLRERPRQVALISANIGLGLGVVLMFGLLGWSFENTLTSMLNGTTRADLIVSSAFVQDGYRGAPLNESILERLLAVPGVQGVAGEQSRDITSLGGTVNIHGIDQSALEDRGIYEWALAPGALPDALKQVGDGEAALASMSFVHEHGVAPGDSVRLQSPSGDVSLRIAGITTTQIENSLFVNRKLYRDLWADPSIYLAHVKLSDPEAMDVVRQRVQELVGAQYRIMVRSRLELIEYFTGQARQAFSLLYLLEGMIFLLVLLGIGDTLSTSVLQRTRLLGMMRAVGISRRQMIRLILLEGLAIGLLGLGLAIVGGLVLGRIWLDVQFPAILGWHLDAYFPWRFAVGGAALALGLCLVGSLLPALRAAYVSIPEALRTE